MCSSKIAFQTLLPMALITIVQIFQTSGNADPQLNGLPCVMRLNQLYCEHKGFNYPSSRIDTYIDDNKKLMRRMYGSLVREEIQPQQPLTPASTSFVRSVRNFGGSRFSRSVDEGFLEDLLLEDEYYNDLDANFTSWGSDDDGSFGYSIHLGHRGKRQAGFPGADGKTDNSKLDACESRTEVTTPFWATNNNGKVRAIVNNKNFEQAVHQEICSTSRTLRCAGDCQCEQKYKWHRLLAYDPNNDCNGIFMDWFLFPSCCACRCVKNPLLA